MEEGAGEDNFFTELGCLSPDVPGILPEAIINQSVNQHESK